MKLRSFALLALVSSTFMSNAFAARKYGMAGCGLGSIFFGAKGSQSSAATTNAASYQSFAITSGTSNCVGDDQATAQLEQEKFVTANFVTLSKEMAQGSGDTLVGLSSVLGCDASVQSEFSSFSQEKYQVVFSSPGAVAALETLKEQMLLSGGFAKSCKYIEL